MSQILLVEPAGRYLPSYIKACGEYKRRGITLHSMHDVDAVDTWKGTIFDSYEKAKRGEGLPEGWVPATTYWLVQGDEFLGMGNIRHRLTPALLRFGGHIGYAVAAQHWNKGYGTLLLKLLLEKAADLGLEKVLLTCDDANIGSYRVMEKNGGRLFDVGYAFGMDALRLGRRYWIDTPLALTKNAQ